MSSLRNAVKRVAHKERSQPGARKKFGLLEKHKDYIERSRDFHKKQDYIKTLKKKAEDRNPDEFYFKMHNAKVTNGVHKEIPKASKSLDMSTVKHLKTQDLGYIVHKKAVNDRKVEKLKQNLHMIGDKKVKSHKIFVDYEQQVQDFDLATHFGTTDVLAKQPHNRVKLETLEKHAETRPALTAATVKRLSDKRDKSYKELDNRAKRAKKLDGALKKLTTQRNLMGKGSKRKVKGSGDEEEGGKGDSDESVPVYKWKRQRLR